MSDTTDLNNCLIHPARISRIKEQGFNPNTFTDEQISIHSIGNRFAFQMCTLLFVTGLVLNSIPILATAAGIAFLGLILPFHPFDLLYNFGVRHLFNRPKFPPRSAQAKFACGIASVWLGAIIFLVYSSLLTWAYVLGGVLFGVAFLVSVFDKCIPSVIYNFLFVKK